MRRSRRGGGGGAEFGGSGEDSFVAVVVTKLTGALLFILLLTMVIMALLPKAIDSRDAGRSGADRAADAEVADLEITTPAALPEAIAGRPYALAPAARGGAGTLQWSLEGELPEGLAFNAEAARLEGTPKVGTPKPVELTLRVSDGRRSAARVVQLLVYQSDVPLATPVWWKPGVPPVPWREWLENGFGFILVWLVHLVGMNMVNALERAALVKDCEENSLTSDDDRRAAIARRFRLYRWGLRAATLAATAFVVVWMVVGSRDGTPPAASV